MYKVEPLTLLLGGRSNTNVARFYCVNLHQRTYYSILVCLILIPIIRANKYITVFLYLLKFRTLSFTSSINEFNEWRSLQFKTNK